MSSLVKVASPPTVCPQSHACDAQFAELDAPDFSDEQCNSVAEHTGRDRQVRVNTLAESLIHQRCDFSRTRVMHCEGRNFKDSRMQTNWHTVLLHHTSVAQQSTRSMHQKRNSCSLAFWWITFNFRELDSLDTSNS